MLLPIALVGSLLPVFLLPVWLWRRSADRPLLERFSLLLLPAVLWLLLAVTGANIIKARTNGWNAARLAPAIALWHGYRLYYEPDDGPVSGNIYGPVAAAYFAPSGLASTPIEAATLAAVLAPLIYFLPVALLLATTAGDAAAAAYGFVVVALITLASDALHYSAFQIHADAPALGFAALAVVALAAPQRRWVAWLGASVLATLAFWSKLPVAGIAPALVLAVAVVDGWRPAVGFAICLAVVGLALSALFLGLCGIDAAIFNLFTVPAAHPWGRLEHWQPNATPREVFPDTVGQRVKAFADSAREFVPLAAVVVAPLLLCWHFLKKYGAADETPRRFERLAQRAVGLAFLTCLPLALAARSKVGASEDSLSFALYFAALLTGMLVATFLREAPRQRGAGFAGITAFTVLALAIWVHRQAPSWSLVYDVAIRGNSPTSYVDESFAYARQNPGQAYFPWYPLAGLLGEGRLDHFAYGVFDRDLAGRRMTSAHFWRYLPPEVRYVCFDISTTGMITDDYFLTYMPDFQPAGPVPGLENWRVYMRK